MPIALLDIIIVVALLSACTGGYRLGFVTRVSSWIGMLAGISAAVLGLPFLLRSASGMAPIERAGIVILLLLAGALLGQMLGLVLGSRLASSVPEGKAQIADRVVGSISGALGVLIVVWLVLPAAADVPGWTSQEVRNSRVAQAVYEAAPEPPGVVQSLQHLVGGATFPEVFEGINPSQDAGPPPEVVTLDPGVQDRVAISTVKVEGVACRRTQDGSGFAIGEHLLVTNAHVVAGENRTTVEDTDGRIYDATVVYFDPARDIALLYAAKYNHPALTMGESKVGEEGAVFGHPGGQTELSVQPAGVSQRITAVGRDLYDKQSTRRDVLVLSAALRQGDSGGVLVNRSGDVIGVAFAIAPDKPNTAYALNVTELQAALGSSRNTKGVDTGDCLTD